MSQALPKARAGSTPWRSSPSAYVVAAESAADVAAAVSFASAHNLRLVVKGRGHSYLGASSAPDSLLVWTRKMDAVTPTTPSPR
jgi:FAD/FMN-containing dehydrogenase